MKIYNTLTKRKEEFIPLEEGKVRMYVCGPTVYNYIHIGNARPVVVFDTVRRYFEYKGYEVNYVMNFTDVDDKIIKRAIEEGVSSSTIAERYIKEFIKDTTDLSIRKATIHPKATEEIDGMIHMIEDLIRKGHAYEKNKTVYFRTRTYSQYGKLSKKNIDELEAGARIAINDEKEDKMDFVLWKPKKEGEPFWASPWGDGRPGWHIECSVMSKKYLGDQIDIHAGGEDLIFPHHENEIAQTESSTGKEFARYWMHNAFINIDNKKMSKSEGNFFTVREISEKYPLSVLRFFLLSVHYRSPINFSKEIMDSAKNGLERIQTAVEQLEYFMKVKKEKEPVEKNINLTADSIERASIVHTEIMTQAEEKLYQEVKNNDTTVPQLKSNDIVASQLKELFKKFEQAMEDDFNTADAITSIFEMVKLANVYLTSDSNYEIIEKVYNKIVLLCDILGIEGIKKKEALKSEVEELIAKRQMARKSKDYKQSDEIRDQLLKMGILLEDTREGVKWKRV